MLRIFVCTRALKIMPAFTAVWGTQQRVMVTKTLRDIKMTQILASYTAGIYKGIEGAWRL